MSWRLDAACRGMGTDLFFIEPGDPHGTEQAKAVCAICPVSDECLTEALHMTGDDRSGIFGGTTWRERRLMRIALGIRIENPLTGPKPCGTAAAYRRHNRAGEQPCRACVDANRLEGELRKERAARTA